MYKSKSKSGRYRIDPRLLHFTLGYSIGKMTNKNLQQPTAARVVAPNEEAQHAADDEKSMGLLQAIKLYPKAVGWSVVLSSSLIMEGYDLALLGSLYGSPQFNRKYGVLNAVTGKYSVPAGWQSAL
jgi:SP family general alpha glucoside:H+ symporter-like MFS transporter